MGSDGTRARVRWARAVAADRAGGPRRAAGAEGGLVAGSPLAEFAAPRGRVETGRALAAVTAAANLASPERTASGAFARVIGPDRGRLEKPRVTSSRTPGEARRARSRAETVPAARGCAPCLRRPRRSGICGRRLARAVAGTAEGADQPPARLSAGAGDRSAIASARRRGGPWPRPHRPRPAALPAPSTGAGRAVPRCATPSRRGPPSSGRRGHGLRRPRPTLRGRGRDLTTG